MFEIAKSELTLLESKNSSSSSSREQVSSLNSRICRKNLIFCNRIGMNKVLSSSKNSSKLLDKQMLKF
jgi:hypothetical protein